MAGKRTVMVKNESTFLINMDEHILPIILPYLCSDRDRVHLMQTCRAFSAYITRTEYKDEYDYEFIENIPYLQNFKNVNYMFSLRLNTLRKCDFYLDYTLKPIPECVTWLYYDSDIPLSKVVMYNNITDIEFAPYFNYPIVGFLPKSVKKIRVSIHFNHPVPDGCELKVYPFNPHL